jgi:hypothetical protein
MMPLNPILVVKIFDV